MKIKDPNDTSYTEIEIKKPMKREESRFETNLATAASYLRCCYIKIPDPIYGSRRVRAMKSGEFIRERRRPFDGLLIVPADDKHYGGTYCLEAKANSNTLEKHQLGYLSAVKNINGMAYVIRVRNRKSGTFYSVEWPEKSVLFETEDMVAFVTWFKELSRIPG
jgi:hypothetical protein